MWCLKPCANGRFLAAGGLLAAEEGLTSARWQVLGAMALSGRRLTVPQIARRMGLTRQSVQASVNRLRGDAVVKAAENPDHRRSPLIQLTELGRKKYAALQRRQITWVNELGAGLKVSDLATTARVLAELSDRLDHTPQAGERRGDDRETPRDGRADDLHAATARGHWPNRAHQ
jgi:DNA-binding MarR family transcriptional regulator